MSRDRKSTEPVSIIESSGTIGDRVCPSCAESIKLEARVCRFCGHQFSEQEVEHSKRTARIVAAPHEASCRKIAAKKYRRQAAVRDIPGQLLMMICVVLVVFFIFMYGTEAKVRDGRPFTIQGLIFTLMLAVVLFGLPGVILRFAANKYREENRKLLAEAQQILTDAQQAVQPDTGKSGDSRFM